MLWVCVQRTAPVVCRRGPVLSHGTVVVIRRMLFYRFWFRAIQSPHHPCTPQEKQTSKTRYLKPLYRIRLPLCATRTYEKPAVTRSAWLRFQNSLLISLFRGTFPRNARHFANVSLFIISPATCYLQCTQEETNEKSKHLCDIPPV